MTDRDDHRHIGVVGAGPRGLSVLERICANVAAADTGAQILVHLVDPHPPGAGSVWRTDQSPDLLMNTVAAQVTVFTDRSVDCAGPVVPGPSLYEWARHVAHDDPLNTLRLTADVRDEAARLGADDYPSRGFHGQYLRWVYRHIRGNSPAVGIVHHRGLAVGLGEQPDGRQTLTLSTGATVADLDAVVLAQGHVGERARGRAEELGAFARAHGLAHVPPANPADVDLSRIAPGTSVLLTGMGLNYFDHQTLLTTSRGGRYTRCAVTGRLSYVPSGREPHLYVGSRRGVPYQARGDNQKAPDQRHDPVVLTAERVEALRERARRHSDLDFKEHVWPLLSLEVEAAYYGLVLVGHLPADRLAAFGDAYRAATDREHRDRVVETFRIPRTLRWSWEAIEHPFPARPFGSRAALRAWMLDRLDRDVELAHQGNLDGAVKAALDVLRDLRNEVRLLVDHGGVRGASYAEHVQQWFTPLNASLSIGPPSVRVEQMAALIRAGVVDVLGEGTTVWADGERGLFAASSRSLPGVITHAPALIEARLPEAGAGTTSDPLLRRLLDSGSARCYRIGDPQSGPVEFGGLAVTERPFRIVDDAGRPHPRRFAFGVPTESVHWVAAAGARPGVNSVTLSDADAVARAAIACCWREADVPGAADTGEEPVLPAAS